MSNKIEMVGTEKNGKVTFMFFDTMIEGQDDLYHRNFYIGDERRVCIDEENNVWLVGIDELLEDWQELYDMVNTTVQMLKDSFGYDLSQYQEHWLMDYEEFCKQCTLEEQKIYEYVLWAKGKRLKRFWKRKGKHVC